ncbi:MAG: hypothetical protein RLZZ15_2959 [Verrucomicrobiota bacterium]
MKLPPPLFVLLTLALAPLARPAPGSSSLEAAWQLASLLRLGEAEAIFRSHLADAGPTAREARYGLGLTLLNLSPKTDRRLAEARAHLEGAAAVAPADDLGLAARFYLARLFHRHLPRPDLPAALAIYESLAEEYPAHYFGQYAVVEASLIGLFRDFSPVGVEPRVLTWQARGRAITDPALRRNFLRNLSLALLRGDGSDAAALGLTQEVDALRFTRTDQRVVTLLRIALLAEGLRDRPLQIAALERYLAEFPRHQQRRFYADQLDRLRD